MRKNSLRAFTLIEIMVALAIIAITLGAIIENTTASNKNAQYLRDKSIAGWVAMNQISLVRAKRQWSNATTKKGTVDMAGRQWIWKLDIQNTDDENVRRLSVDVYAEDDERQALASVTGFLGKL
jgi:general secretion pathway protein I